MPRPKCHAQTRFTIRLGPGTPLAADIAVSIADATDGRFSMRGSDRLVTRVPPRQSSDATEVLEACEQALVELVTLARLR